MVDKQIDKYNELEIEYFSNGTPWTYEWEFEGKPSLLDWNYELKRYEYWQSKTLLGTFPDVYAALDGIILGKKTLRQMLLETDFDFSSILGESISDCISPKPQDWSRVSYLRDDVRIDSKEYLSEVLKDYKLCPEDIDKIWEIINKKDSH